MPKVISIVLYILAGKCRKCYNQVKWMLPCPEVRAYHWDHIIPESLVSKSSKDDDKNWFGNNLTNCQALPRSKNTAKSAHALNSTQCKDTHLAKAIETYSGIKKSEQKNYGDESKLKDLCIWRGKHIIDTFLTKRNMVI